ncbi:MAG: calcium-binding protein [Microcoleaceae cyanobacterium]
MTTFLVPSQDAGLFGVNALVGTEGNDTISLINVFTTPFTDGILLLGGNDSLQGFQTLDSINVNGNRGNDSIAGGLNNDILFGGRDQDVLFGGDGGSDQIFGNLGNDVLAGGPGDDSLFGGQQNDIVYGGSGNDQLFGDLGDDVLDGDAGRDSLTGGPGRDTFVFDPGEASFNINDVDEIRDFTVDSLTFEANDRIVVPSGTRINEASLERDIDINRDGLLDIPIELQDGRFLGVIINDGNLFVDRILLDVDIVANNSFDFNL